MIVYRVTEQCPFDSQVQHADFSSREKANAFVASFSKIIRSGMHIEAVTVTEIPADLDRIAGSQQ